jgi:DNA modification methylase
VEVNRCEVGDCREIMRHWVAEGVKVQMCVTSPPYWGLRDYGVAGQIGLEFTPQEYVANMVEVFRLVRDLLADDGTLWLNLGDSYAASPKGSMNGQDKSSLTSSRTQESAPTGINKLTIGLKPKDLVGIPWRVAFALQADGWYLRQDIIWAKPNPMPESVRDRCTKSHEYLFLLSKNERYYYDADAIAERSIGIWNSYESFVANGPRPKTPADSRLKRLQQTQFSHDTQHPDKDRDYRNKRSVWTVTTQPYPEAHFATFPPALIEPCILAGSRVGDVVFDPFLGSGTTAQVAQDLGRRWLGCELNPEYATLQSDRTRQAAMVL